MFNYYTKNVRDFIPKQVGRHESIISKSDQARIKIIEIPIEYVLFYVYS